MGTQNRKIRNLPYMDGSYECIPGIAQVNCFFRAFAGRRLASRQAQDTTHNNYPYQQDSTEFHNDSSRLIPGAESTIYSQIGLRFALKVNRSGYLRPLSGEKGDRRDRKAIAVRSSSTPDAGRRTLATCLWATNNSSRRKTPTRSMKMNGTATKAVCQPEFKTDSCTYGLKCPH